MPDKPPVYNDFATDTHRRVLAHAMRPRSAAEIAYQLAKVDLNVDTSAYQQHGVQSILDDLEADGLVKNLGTFEDGKEALAAQDKDKDVINFSGSKEAFHHSADNPLGFPFLDRADHYVMTKKGHAKLTGEVPPSEDGGGPDPRPNMPANLVLGAGRPA